MSNVTDIVIHGFPSKEFMNKLNKYMTEKYQVSFNEVSDGAGGKGTCDVYLVGVNYFESLDSFKSVLQSFLPNNGGSKIIVMLDNDHLDTPECFLIMVDKILPYKLLNNSGERKC